MGQPSIDSTQKTSTWGNQKKVETALSYELNPRMHLLYAQLGFFFSARCAFYGRALDPAPCMWSQHLIQLGMEAQVSVPNSNLCFAQMYLQVDPWQRQNLVTGAWCKSSGTWTCFWFKKTQSEENIPGGIAAWLKKHDVLHQGMQRGKAESNVLITVIWKHTWSWV